MMFTDPNQIAIIVLVLIVGLVLGLILAPKGTKWRTRYEAERDAHAAFRQDADDKMRDRDVRVGGAATRPVRSARAWRRSSGGWRRRWRMGVPGRGRSVPISRAPSWTRRSPRGRACGGGRGATRAEAE